MKRALIVASIVEGIGAVLLTISHWVQSPTLSMAAMVLNYPVMFVLALTRGFGHADLGFWQWLALQRLRSGLSGLWYFALYSS